MGEKHTPEWLAAYLRDMAADWPWNIHNSEVLLEAADALTAGLTREQVGHMNDAKRWADALIEAERRGAERMRERVTEEVRKVARPFIRLRRLGRIQPERVYAQPVALTLARLVCVIRALPLTEETPDADA